MTDNSSATLMVDVAGYHLSAAEKKRLHHPLVGGVILFSRNFASYRQLQKLVQEIKALKNPALVVAVDHEGGRVQRFTEGFTRLPPMGLLGQLFDSEGDAAAVTLAYKTGWVLAAELRCCDFDFSFTPVLDLNWGRCAVIGDRSFHHDPEVVIRLAGAFIKGLRQGGFANCGKHYPGHGFAAADSHVTIPVDERPPPEIAGRDLAVFAALIKEGLTAVMPAHVIYPQIDPDLPAGFSPVWLQKILRGRLDFQGLIISDSLTMAGAAGVGTVRQRVKAAAVAGCDILLICNDAAAVDELLKADVLPLRSNKVNWDLIRGLRTADFYREMTASTDFKEAQREVAALGRQSAPALSSSPGE